MPETVSIVVNGNVVAVRIGTVVSAAMLIAQQPCRISSSGEPRTAVCGMGICYECRARVNGVLHQRTCQLVCQPGMVVETQR